MSDGDGKTKASESTASLVGPAADGRESDFSREAGGAQPPTNTQLPEEGSARLDGAWDLKIKNRHITCYIKIHQFLVLKTDLDFLIQCSSQGKCLWAKCGLQLTRSEPSHRWQVEGRWAGRG